MEKRKRWQVVLIGAVLALTIYNILPTLFFYSKSLDRPVGEKSAQHVSAAVAQRVNGLEDESINWLRSYSKNLRVKPKSISAVKDDPKFIEVTFDKPLDAQRFRTYLPRAGALIPFVPAQLGLSPVEQSPNTVVVVRNVSASFPKDALGDFFQFSTKEGPLYKKISGERVEKIGVAAGGISEPGQILTAVRNPQVDLPDDMVMALAQQIVDYEKAFGVESGITRRFYRSFTQVEDGDKGSLVQALISRLEKMKGGLGKRQVATVDRALTILKDQGNLFRDGLSPLKEQPFVDNEIAIGDRNPFVKSVVVDWEEDRVELVLHDDVQALRSAVADSEITAFRAEKLGQLLLNDIARISRISGEEINPEAMQFAASLSSLPGSQSALILDLGAVAKQKAEGIQKRLENNWVATSPDLQRANFPILENFETLSPEQQKLGLWIYAPAASDAKPMEGFRPGSIYVIGRGLNQIAERYRNVQVSENDPVQQDFKKLFELLASSGFVSYPGSAYGMPAKFKDDFIFELSDYYDQLLAATREKFTVRGDKRYAVLEFTDEKQRLLTRNEIDTKTHEDLLKWRDEYQSAQVDPDLHATFVVPKPTRNVFFDNFKLSTVKYFRGDDRKVLKWGLDLSGGKSVTVALRDQNNRPVTNPDELREGANELYKRVNAMGVAEVEIRVEGEHILLNFPGAQGLSADELIQGSTMSFHIVNEQFSRGNSELQGPLNRFLQEVWNEAVVTNRKDAESINEIAWQHLGADFDTEVAAYPRSQDAQVLYDAGLRLANPNIDEVTSNFDDTLSSVAMFRGDSYAEWQGQSTPLLIVYNNYALEGSNLDGVHADYDPSKGNVLVFGVQKTSTDADGARVHPQADLFTWTSQFAQNSVSGTPRELYSDGQGWRMAVVLNGSVISAPRLLDAISDRGTVTGQFSQREVNQLVADLKAGSLSYTPKVVQERNVSPELGQQERTKGISAAVVGLILVMASMIWYYRFAGVIASVAVLFNLLIMWGVLQNLDAALSLPGIAGIILTMGMAVDANVLVFERIREEFINSKRLGPSIQIGYKKAFSAIVDSNITTIIAALILLNFDAGPIKAFAVTLIIGILSSMFTALFMTRTFFSGWVQNPLHSQLRMRNFFSDTHYNFLSKAKVAISGSVLVILVGLAFLTFQRHTIFGMDFTGGYSLAVNLEEQADTSYRDATTNALVNAGATAGEVQVRALNKPNHLRIQLGMGMEQVGHPFHLLAERIPADEVPFAYQTNPRIDWVVNALSAGGLTVQPESLAHLTDSWSLMSGQFSDAMKTSAMWGLGLALLSILIYVTIRFEFKYAVSAIIALAHDLLITVGILAILNKLGMGVQIDLQVVGAMMTIIGYSLNDTIIVFDRIREDGRIYKKLTFNGLINHALNKTLNRTLLTSLTTLLVLVALVLFGGKVIFDFSLVMLIGVVVGTFSSLFIASPVLLAFHRREETKKESAAA